MQNYEIQCKQTFFFHINLTFLEWNSSHKVHFKYFLLCIFTVTETNGPNPLYVNTMHTEVWFFFIYTWETQLEVFVCISFCHYVGNFCLPSLRIWERYNYKTRLTGWIMLHWQMTDPGCLPGSYSQQSNPLSSPRLHTYKLTLQRSPTQGSQQQHRSCLVACCVCVHFF